MALATVLVLGAGVLVLAMSADGARGPHAASAPLPASSLDAYNPAPISARLTPRQLAGERVIYSYPGLTPPASLIRAIRAGQAGGVVFFSQNISSRSQLKAVAAQLQVAARRSPVKLPLLLMTDQEGGLVRRLPGAPIYSEKQIGQLSDAAAAARRAGRGAGLNLRGAGLNLNLSPVLDVYRQAGNFIDQYGRSYGSNPHLVSALGAAFITKQQQAGVAATAKHFPGLGAAGRSQNTDAGRVTLSTPLSQIRDIDELPYRAAISAHLDLVMVSWARYQALDSARPAGLSAKVVLGELRGRLRFRGVTITDALEAGALKGFGGTAERAYLAAGAGMDLILCAGKSPSQGAAAVKALTNALTSRHLGRQAFLASVDRILSLRHSLAP